MVRYAIGLSCRRLLAMLTDAPDNSEQAEAGKGVPEEIWAAGANQSGTLTQAAVVICRVRVTV